MFAIGRPSGAVGAASPASQRQLVTSIVVSVGP
jgi:hypothetical protein